LLNFLDGGHIKVDQQHRSYDFEIKAAKVFATCNEINRLSKPLQLYLLAYDDAFHIMKNWLRSCHKMRPLDFNVNVKIKDALRAATRVGYLPMAFNDSKSEDVELYRDISNRFENHKLRG
jgi:hypothetical protein